MRRLASGLVLLVVFSLLTPSCSLFRSKLNKPYEPQKREFRGAWMPTIFRSEYSKLGRDDARALLLRRLDLLSRTGCNVVVFQVRAEGDAWYQNSREPWSKYFTGQQGQGPKELWDPLGFMIDECHKRGMELHAWINPYRGASNASAPLAPNHVARLHPEWFVRYNNQLILDPGLPDGRDYVISVVKDIVQRYDVDAIHLDDYFYPYPAKEEVFNDSESFSQYGVPVGYTMETKDNWRRNNVNLLISGLKSMLLDTKPWVRLGVAPFGIYRNKSTEYPKGSQTNGLEAYNTLYSDVLYWAKEGWIDYVAPQIYWNIGYDIADYEVLTQWWSKNIRNKRVQLYIGQDIKRTMSGNQLDIKLKLSQELSQGNLWWPADELYQNYGGISEQLRKYYQPNKALLPEISGSLGTTHAPQSVDVIWEDHNEDGHMILWNDVRVKNDPEKPYYYVVYAFDEDETPSVGKFKNIVYIGTDAEYKLPAREEGTKYTFLVTTVNRFWQESLPKSIVVRYQ